MKTPRLSLIVIILIFGLIVTLTLADSKKSKKNKKSDKDDDSKSKAHGTSSDVNPKFKPAQQKNTKKKEKEVKEAPLNATAFNDGTGNVTEWNDGPGNMTGWDDWPMNITIEKLDVRYETPRVVGKGHGGDEHDHHKKHGGTTCEVQGRKTDVIEEIEDKVTALRYKVNALTQPVHIHVHGGQVSSQGRHNEQGGQESSQGRHKHMGCCGEHHRSDKEKNRSGVGKESHDNHDHNDHGNRSVSHLNQTRPGDRSPHSHSSGNRSQDHDHKSHGHKSHSHKSHGHKSHGHKSHGQNSHGHKSHGHKSHGQNSHGHKSHGHESHGCKGQSQKGKDDYHGSHGSLHGSHGHHNKGHGHHHGSASHHRRGHDDHHIGHGHSHSQNHTHSHSLNNHTDGHHDRSHKHDHLSGDRSYRGRDRRFHRGHDTSKGHGRRDQSYGGRSTHVHIHVTLDEKPRVGHVTKDVHSQTEAYEHNVTDNKVPIYARCDIRSYDVNNYLVGYILLRQKSHETIEVKVNISGFSVPLEESVTTGNEPNEDSEDVPIRHLRGFHVHEFGDFSQGCSSFGGHFNPEGAQHGGLDHEERHVGDLGNLEVDDLGVAIANITVTDASLRGHHSIIGRGIVVHGQSDDQGQGNTPASKASGNAGARLGCCVIAYVKAIPESEW